ncbi:prepilin peptidase [Corynebacterium callunae]|uniref:prepilin peptidase n=1 Tax=Corynebacterium callunae TaxID=1721 RepID=UPI001039A07C|nr:A24 family peptidase [Corynebacterium callunae]MCK2200288.1 A24 family peptidase [Corynebacterium callunae]
MGHFIFALWCALLVVWDLRWRRLPNWLTLPGALFINLWATLQDPLWVGGGLLWAGLYFLTAVLFGGIGGGDVKFAAGLGTAVFSLGAEALVLAIVGSSLISVLLGGILRVMKGRRGVVYIPHGPSMSIASTCAYVIFM